MTAALNPWYNIVNGRHSSYRYKHLNLDVEDVSGVIQLTRQSKNQEFHEIFPTIPPNVSLVEVYNCSWIVDIPIQRKLYLSTEFICFVSNAFSGTIRKVIPLDDLEEIQKETDIELFPNGIGVKTKNSWYFFSTFYSRDEAFNLIYRLHFDFKTKLDGEVAQVDHSALELNAVDDSYYGIPFLGPRTHPPTDSKYVEKEGDNFICDESIQAPLGVVYELLFGNDTKHIIKILKDQNNYDFTKATIVGISDNEKYRAYSHTKPLTNVVGPKRTKCNIQETLHINDLELMLVEQISSTPDVPSGNAFLLKTRIFLSWGDHNSTRFFVVTNIEKSWLKGSIEIDSVEGQKKFMNDIIVSCGKILDGYKNRLLRA